MERTRRDQIIPPSRTAYEISKTTAFFFLTAALMLVPINVILMQQNRELRALIGERKRSLELKPGTIVPPLDGLDISGNRLRIEYGEDSRKTILLVFSPGCGICDENMPRWEALVRRLDMNSFRVIAVSLIAQGTREYINRYDLRTIPVIAEPDPEGRIAYNLVLTPQTILISSDAKVEKVWTGVLRGEKQKELEQSLNVELPIPE